jgi:hypothetical protein
MAFRKPPEGWSTFGSHVDEPVRLEFSEELADDLMPLWERPLVACHEHGEHPAGELLERDDLPVAVCAQTRHRAIEKVARRDGHELIGEAIQKAIAANA